MKKIIPVVAIASVVMFSGTSLAMKPRMQAVDPQVIVDQMNLDQATADALLEKIQSHRMEMGGPGRKGKGMGPGAAGTYEEHKARMDKRDQHRADIKNLLGEERYDQFHKLMWEQRQQLRAQNDCQRRGPKGGKRGQGGWGRY